MNTASGTGVSSVGASTNDPVLASDLQSIDLNRDHDGTSSDEHPLGNTLSVKEADNVNEGSEASSGESGPKAGEESEDEDGEEGPVFFSLQCLFCDHVSSDFDTNLTHMSKIHSMIIPEEEHLLVDLETLLQYLHLTINTYIECIYCGSSRRNAEAVKQHMMARHHCRFDITDANSEYRDFYDFELERTSGEVVDETTMRLSDGRLLSHRTAHTVKRHTPSNAQHNRLLPTSSASVDACTPASSTAQLETKQLTRAELRSQVLITQLSTMRHSDQRSLAHLPVSEQRTLLATQKQQVEMARKVERRMQGRVQGKGNKTLMKHFKPDVPGRSNG